VAGTTVVYNSLAEKLRLFVSCTIPLIFKYATAGAEHRHNWAVRSIRPDQVHETARAGRYVGEDGNWDLVQDLDTTERDGGDCEDWAAWLLCENWRRGVQARLVTSGDSADPFRHVYVEVFDGVWRASNPKGSQEGMPYGVAPEHEVKRRWSLVDGRVIELIDVAGAGADATAVAQSQLDAITTIAPNTPAVMGWREWRAVPLFIRKAFWKAVEQGPVGGGAGERQRQLESEFIGNVTRSELLSKVPWAAPPNRAGEYPVRNYSDLFRGLTAPQQSLFWGALRSHVSAAEPDKVRAALKAGTYGETRESMLRLVRMAALGGGSDGWVEGQVRKWRMNLQPLPLDQVATLGQLNLQLASQWAAEMIAPGEFQAQTVPVVRQIAISIGGNPNADNEKLAAVAAAWVSQLFTAQNVAMDDAVVAQSNLDAAASQTTRVAAANSLIGSAVNLVSGSAGIGDSLKRLVRHPLKWVRNVVGEVGKGTQQLAQNILDADKNVPWLAQFLTKPLGIHFAARLVNEIGAVLAEYSVSAFDETQLARDAAMTLVASGQAAATAAPFCGPWALPVAAIAAASIAAGTYINGEIDRKQEAREKAEAKKAGAPDPGQVSITYMVDEFGREIGADGLPVDPIQREAELARRATQGQPVSKRDQVLHEWRRGNDGLLYGWQDAGRYGAVWASVQDDSRGEFIHAWVEVDGKWVQLV